MKTTLLTHIGAFLLAAVVAIHPSTARAASESPSELLEKGIYNQETKGDLDSAIAIYQQLIAEANANQSLAAEAQFRLGQCYLKKSRSAEATAAFEKLIHDFPNEKGLVAKARELLPDKFTLGPVPWVGGERLQLNISLLNGTDIGTCEYRADFVQQANGRKLWRVGARMMAGPQSVSSVDADAETFRPVSSRWKNSLLGEVSAVYRPYEVEVQRVGKTQPTITPLDQPVLDNEEAMHSMRRLPLQVGYKTTLTVFTALGGSRALPIGLEVVGRETVETPAGKFDCFKVHLALVNQDFWFSDDAHRYLVKFEAGPAVAQLMSVTQRRPGEPVQFRDEELGISFTAPPDWVIWRARQGQPEGQVLIRMLDPEADTEDGGMRLFTTDSLSEAARQSARAWAEERLGKNKSIQVRPDSWKDVTIDGRQGVSFVAEYNERDKTYEQFLAFVPGAKYSEMFVLTCAPEKFDALKTQFDSILASYRRQ
jgi:Protein of unknown function (DUF3108)/Tetratricopeptide repeat